MTRLFINIFFIVIICFTLSVMPLNSEILGMFDFGDLFENEEAEIVEEVEPIDETFVAEYSVDYLIDEEIVNPINGRVILSTNIPSSYEKNYNFKDLKMTLSQNDEVYAHIAFDKLVENYTIDYKNDLIEISYDLDLDFNNLNLNRDGFFESEIYFDQEDKSDLNHIFNLTYRPEIDYVTNGSVENNGNFIYKAYFLNETETALVPLYFSVEYPESITVEARNRLYNSPPASYGLSSNPVLPSRTSVAWIADKHYGVFFYSDEIEKIITSNERAELAVDSIIKTLIRLPHIEKISLFVDGAQVEGSFFDIELNKVYQAPIQSYAYLTETTPSKKRYLIPLAVSESNIYDEVWSIFNILKTGNVDGKQWTQIIPPEVTLNNFMIEGTTITADFNQALLSAYEDQEYQGLMINSILYSFTSIENINRVKITIDGSDIDFIGAIDFTDSVLAPPYINYIGEFE